MKTISTLLLATVLSATCTAQSASETFKKNSATVMEYVNAYLAESVDYDKIFAEDCVFAGTAFGARDSNSVADKMKRDKEIWAKYDIKLLPEELNMLPGVNAETKKMDGSVRYYAAWEVTKPGMDGAESKSGVIRTYTSYDFNKEGKVIYMQSYGDYGGLMHHLDGHDDEE